MEPPKKQKTPKISEHRDVHKYVNNLLNCLILNLFYRSWVGQFTRQPVFPFPDQNENIPQKRKNPSSLYGENKGSFSFSDHFDLSPFSFKTVGRRGYDDTNGLNGCYII